MTSPSDWQTHSDRGRRSVTIEGWTKTADQIVDRICRYRSRISEPAH